MEVAEGLKPLLTDITKIKLDAKNARKHPERNLEAIKLSLQNYGQRKPIVVNAQNDTIEAGNGLYLAAKALGWTQIAAVYVNDSDVTQKAYGIMDNQSALLADWDLPVLKDLLTELDTGDLDMEVTGFSVNEIEDLMNQTFQPQEGLPPDDQIPEKVETICKRGDLWKLGNHRLLCGDSTVITDVERLMGGEKADMVFTDPPYGVGFKYKTYDDVGGEAYEQFCKDWFALLQTMARKIAITSGCYPLKLWLSSIGEPKQIGVWIKTNALTHGSVVHFMTWEPILFFGDFERKRANDVFDYPISKQPDTGDHSCPKPIGLIADIIENFSKQKDKVLDIFGGSGSTLIACEKLNRRCYMMEIDEHYCDVIITRWQDFTGQKAELIHA